LRTDSLLLFWGGSRASLSLVHFLKWTMKSELSNVRYSHTFPGMKGEG